MDNFEIRPCLRGREGGMPCSHTDLDEITRNSGFRAPSRSQGPRKTIMRFFDDPVP